MFAHNGTHRRMLAAVLAFAAPAFLLTACNDDPLFEIPPDAPTDVAVAVQGTSATVTWTPGAGATSQEVRMSPLVPVPASAGTALLVEDDRVQTFDDNTTSSAVFENLTEGTSYSTTVTAINGSSRTSSEALIVVISPPANAPILTTFAIEIDPLGFAVAWTPTATPSENYRVVLTGDDGEDPISDIFPSAATDAFFDAELYPFVEGVTYTAQVFAVNGTEEIGSNTLQLTADFFPWDDYFPTSLHVTGAGKPFYYNTTPNLGFERYTGIPYTDLACQGCHAVDSGFEGPATGKTCDRCHSTTDPQIGDDDVDATLDGACGVCHGRQKAEAGAYSDVHRTAGVDCMFCHTMGDVHGDGTIYRTMIEDGAIDAKCETCHPWDEHQGNNIHGEAVYCTACHAASIVTCNNCHFDSEVNDHVKIFKGPPAMDWLFLLNRTVEGEEYVTVGNYQSVIWQDTSTLVAFGPYTPHTIMPAAESRDCADCHGEGVEAIAEYNANGTIQVVSFDAELNVIHPMGVVPFPEDYLTSYLFDWVSIVPGTLVPGSPPMATWQAVPADTDTIQILPEFVRPLDVVQMEKIDMVAPAP
jgi:hypothetical protein